MEDPFEIWWEKESWRFLLKDMTDKDKARLAFDAGWDARDNDPMLKPDVPER